MDREKYDASKLQHAISDRKESPLTNNIEENNPGEQINTIATIHQTSTHEFHRQKSLSFIIEPPVHKLHYPIQKEHGIQIQKSVTRNQNTLR